MHVNKGTKDQNWFYVFSEDEVVPETHRELRVGEDVVGVLPTAHAIEEVLTNLIDEDIHLVQVQTTDEVVPYAPYKLVPQLYDLAKRINGILVDAGIAPKGKRLDVLDLSKGGLERTHNPTPKPDKGEGDREVLETLKAVQAEAQTPVVKADEARTPVEAEATDVKAETPYVKPKAAKAAEKTKPVEATTEKAERPETPKPKPIVREAVAAEYPRCIKSRSREEQERLEREHPEWFTRPLGKAGWHCIEPSYEGLVEALALFNCFASVRKDGNDVVITAPRGTDVTGERHPFGFFKSMFELYIDGEILFENAVDEAEAISPIEPEPNKNDKRGRKNGRRPKELASV